MTIPLIQLTRNSLHALPSFPKVLLRTLASMAQSIRCFVVWIVLLLFFMAMAEATPPGIANHPSHARCNIPKYKHCYNLEHVCPKFCSNGCTVECASCKPICIDGPTPTPTPPDSEAGGAGQSRTSPPPPTATSPPPLPPSPPPPTTPPTLPPPTTSPPHPTPTPPTSPSNQPPPPPYSPTPTPTTPSLPSPPSHTPSNPPPATPSSTPSSPKKAKCKIRDYPQCYNTEHVCPSSCPGGCEVDCVACKPVCKCDMPGAVCQDPRFIGGDGITFYFHGKKDSDFCLVSDANLHINGHFIGRRNQNMKRDFTWVQSIGILFDNHKLFIGAQKAATWDDNVDHLALAFDGEPLVLEEAEGAKWKSKAVPSVSIARVGATSTVIVEVEGKFKITAKVVPITEEDSRVHNYGITNDDCFAHLDLSFKFFSLSDRVNGVLGLTYRSNYTSPVKMNVAMPVVGGDREFATSSLFATDCAVASFLGSHNYSGGEASMEILEPPSLSCGSGMDGHGVVCKR